ncbi:MAG TPA: 6-bladed beta-propeller [Gemmatimonadaceae bacterium]|nr:6-bladed beta-propeller [Gemmatimonadaceae bacterium]
MASIVRTCAWLVVSTAAATVTAQQTAPQWRASDAPIVRITYEEGFAQIVSAGFLGDGSIFVGDVQHAKVLLFDSTGRLVHSIGRKGGGPAEFQNLQWVRAYGRDSIATYDAAQRRVSILDRNGRFARSVTLLSPTEGLSPTAAAVLDDGHIIVRVQRPVSSEVPPGVHPVPLELWTYSPSGAPLNRLVGNLVGEEWVKLATPRVLMSRPFATLSLVAIGPNHIYIADSASFPVRVLSAPSGTTTRIDGTRTTPIASGPHLAAYREQRLSAARASSNTNALSLETRMLDAIPFPSHVPQLSKLLVDTDGRVLAQQYPEPDWRRQQYLVYSPTGALVARLTGPERASVVAVRGDRVLVIRRDADDVQNVEVHTIQR